jgi:hypothetical protein
MATTSSLPRLDRITDESSASDALTRTLAAVAMTNRKLATAPTEEQSAGLHEDLATFHEHLKETFEELHDLLPKILLFEPTLLGGQLLLACPTP